MADFNLASFCTGYGGLDLGVELAIDAGLFAGVAPGSARVVVHVEREAFACKLLASRMEEQALAPAPVWSDLRTFDGRPWRGCVDLVAAGIPCQGNSLAGKRLLGDDPRNLWPDTRRILREMEPEWFLLENVYGFLVPGGGRSAPIARVLGELAEDGWDAEWIVLRAADVGAPHKRERIFLLAHHPGRGRRKLRTAPGRDGLAQQDSGALEHAENDHGRRGIGGAQAGAREDGGGRRGLAIAERGVADAGRERPQGLDEPGTAPGAVGRGDGALADAAGGRWREREPGARPEGRGPDRGTGDFPLFPPGPRELEKWRRVIAVRPDIAPAIESPFRIRSDGASVLVGGGMTHEVQDVRSDASSETLLIGRAGKPIDARATAVLQPRLHGNVSAEIRLRVDALWALGEGTPAFEEGVRALREYAETIDPSHRQELAEQLAAEPDNVMCFLSHHSPYRCRRDIEAERAPRLSSVRDAFCSEGFTPSRVFAAVWMGVTEATREGRLDRLRALGNGVVPLQAALAVATLRACFE